MSYTGREVQGAEDGQRVHDQDTNVDCTSRAAFEQ